MRNFFIRLIGKKPRYRVRASSKYFIHGREYKTVRYVGKDWFVDTPPMTFNRNHPTWWISDRYDPYK